MLKKTLMTAAAALAITAGATTISTPDANAGVKFNITLGGGYYGGHHGYQGYYGGHHGYSCSTRRVRRSYWHHRHGHRHTRWVWRTFC